MYWSSVWTWQYYNQISYNIVNIVENWLIKLIYRKLVRIQYNISYNIANMYWSSVGTWQESKNKKLGIKFFLGGY